MTLWEYYLQYTGEILEGKRPCPPGIEISGEGEEARTLSLLRQAGELGIEEFVRACAWADGLVDIPAASTAKKGDAVLYYPFGDLFK